jgi:hypothetical protein
MQIADDDEESEEETTDGGWVHVGDEEKVLVTPL